MDDGFVDRYADSEMNPPLLWSVLLFVVVLVTTSIGVVLIAS